MPSSFLTDIPHDIAALTDYRRYAEKNLSADIWSYIDGGVADETTLERNLSVYSQIQLHNRVLTDVSQGSTRLNLFGEALAHPIMIAPVAFHQLAHPEGELASAAAAAAQQAVFTLSTYASISIEQLASQVQGQHWFQLYFQQPREINLDLIRRAENAGFKAIVLTVDAPINGLRNREQRAGFTLPSHIKAENLTPYTVQPPSIQPGESTIFQGFMAQAPTWEDVAWLRQHSKLPFIIKGITHPLDALKAKEYGADAVVVSNHSGRSLDTLPNPIEVLASVRSAVGDMPLIVDSGIRRGSDIVKAYALGANAVMIGRPVLYALATAGALGVAHCLRLLRDELELSMALCGYAHLADIDANCLFQNDFIK